MKAQTRTRIDKMKKELLTGAPIHEIMLRLSEEFGIAPNSMRYFLSRANRELEDETEDAKLMMQMLREAMIQQQASGLMATDAELDHYLTQIVRGERQEERIVCTQSGTEVVKVAVKSRDLLEIVRHLRFRIYQVNHSTPKEPERKESVGSGDIMRLLNRLDGK